MKDINLKNYIGKYLPSKGDTSFRTLDGSDVAEWLNDNGYVVVDNFDNGRSGVAITSDGYIVSTNGYVSTI